MIQNKNPFKMELSRFVCNYLNQLLEVDYQAISSLVRSRVPISDTALLDHPTCLVTTEEGEEPMVGLLGVVNGILLEDSGDNRVVSGIYDENDKLIKFEVIAI